MHDFSSQVIGPEINKEAKILAILILWEKKGRKEGKKREGEKRSKEEEKEAREEGKKEEGRKEKEPGNWLKPGSCHLSVTCRGHLCKPV